MDAQVALNGGGDDTVAPVAERLHGPLDQFPESQHLRPQGHQFVVALCLLLSAPLPHRAQGFLSASSFRSSRRW